MEFALKSLADAFKSASYQKDRRSFRLFAFLLATPADRRLIPELLLHFNELHHATGDDLLLIAPSFHMRVGSEWREPTSDEAMAVLDSGIFPAYMGSQIELVNVGDQVSRFLRSLTEQSYDLSRFLGLERSQIPCMLFFEKLVLPPEFICWGLRNTDAHEVVVRVRSMLDELHRSCGWDLAQKIRAVEYELSHPNPSSISLLRRGAESLRGELPRREQTVAFLSALYQVREACEALVGSEHDEFPLERLRGNILRLCGEPDNEAFTTYVRRQRGNWKRRLPADFLAALDQFLAIAARRRTFWRRRPDGETLEEQIASANQAVADVRIKLDEQLKAIEDEPARARQALEVELSKLQGKRAQACAAPLEVLRAIGFGDIRGARPEIGQRPPDEVSGLFEYLSCFISYSSRDAEFARRLHADLVREGVRCWFAPEDLRIGETFRQRIDDSIRAHDKLLLVLSAESISSSWVEAEVEAAFERERNEHKIVLFPIKLDDAIMNTQMAWAANIRRTRHIGDFRGRISGVAYEASINRLLRDLRRDDVPSAATATSA